MRLYKIYITKYNFKEDRYEEISFHFHTNRIEEKIGYILEHSHYPIIKIDYEEIQKNGKR